MLLFTEVMALMRLWDDNTEQVHSILTLADRLSDDDLVTKLVERERNALQDIRAADMTLGEGHGKVAFAPGRETADEREQSLRQAIPSWIADVKSAKARAEVASLKKQRHESFAHSAAFSKVPKVRPMDYDDAEKVLQMTIPIVSTGFRLATGIDHDFSTAISVWKNRQFDMWEIVRCAARGHQFSPLARINEDFIREFTEKGVTCLPISG